MKQWIKDVYVYHLKYNYPISNLQMFKAEGNAYIYINTIPNFTNHYTLEQGIKAIINAKVD